MSLALDVQATLPPEAATNARSIADSLAMPRETGRRKVNDLIARGLVLRLDDGPCFAPSAGQTLAPMRNKVIWLAAHYHGLVATWRPWNERRRRQPT